MPDGFIPKGTLSRFLIMEKNNSKRKDYGVNLAKNNNTNYLHYVNGFA